MVISETEAKRERDRRRAADDAAQQAVWTSIAATTYVTAPSVDTSFCDTSSVSVDTSCSF